MANDLPTYVIDTSALDHIDGRPDANAVWATVTRLIEEGRLKTVEQVMTELGNVDPDSHARLSGYGAQFVERITPDLFTEAGRISETYRRMSRPWHRNDSADPWLVELAKMSGYTVVTDEMPSRQRIPVVCNREGVEWTNLVTFVEAELHE